MKDLFRISKALSRSISPENPTGGKGMGAMDVDGIQADCARDLGKGWKISPKITIKAKTVATLADIEGPGTIEQIWMTPTGPWRFSILHIYWDGQEHPSVECPVGDFFASGWERFQQISSLAVCVNPGSAFNCYWLMPFAKRCRITMENIGEEDMNLFFQINYSLAPVPADAGYFHAQFRRSNPLPYKTVHTILDGVTGAGHYVGTYIAWGANNNGWCGEGEIKFYLDGDREYPTICGTGTEDYFCGSYNFENQVTKQYQNFTTPYAGFHVHEPQMPYGAQTRFNLYRWHLTDPIRFQKDLRVTIQALGWRSGGRYLPLQDDIASTAFWYQSLPGTVFPALPDKDSLEVR